MAVTAQLLSVRTNEGEQFLLLVIRLSSPIPGKHSSLRWLDKDRKYTSTPKLERFSEPVRSRILSLSRDLIVEDSKNLQLLAPSANNP